MNPGSVPRPFKLKVDAAAAADRPWRIRTPDGRVRGPLDRRSLQTMLEVGVLRETAEIAPADVDDWQPVTEHEVWAQLIRKAPATVAAPAPASLPAPKEAASAPVATVLPIATTPAMAERMRAVRRREARKLARGVWLERARLVLAGFRIAVLFLLFLSVGDFVNEIVPANLGVVRLGAQLVLLSLGLGSAVWLVFKSR